MGFWPSSFKNRLGLYQLHRVAVAYGQRPSAILGIDSRANGPAAYAVDNATQMWGDFVENKLAEVDADGAHTYTPEELLGEWGTVERYAPASDLLARFQATGGR